MVNEKRHNIECERSQVLIRNRYYTDLLLHTQKVAEFLCGQVIFLLTETHEQQIEVSP